MKTHMLVWIFFWTSVVVLHRFTKAECEDPDGFHCEKRKCEQPGYAQYCGKTCDTCKTECQDGQYPPANGTCADTCPRGRWGPSCTKNCNKGCVDNNCNPVNGVCLKGCKPCYEGSDFCQTVKPKCICNSSDRCTCHAGYYGNDCAEICSTNCKFKECNDNGDCTRGCNAGKYGPKCNKQCPNCINGTCSLYLGNCTYGCKAGFYGVKCNDNCSSNCLNGKCQRDGRCENCPLGRFDDTCDKDCPINCASHFCNHTDFSCSSCKSGFHSDHCNVTCPDNCTDGICDQHDGSCQRCKGGYRGSHCMLSCSDQCTVCDQYGDRCSSCSQGWYGKTCYNECDMCLGNECNVTGTCFNGCKTGWFGDKCEQKCNFGCKNSSCDRNTGICTEGCTDTVYGDYCDVRCPQHCLRCDRYNGSCLECEGNRYGYDCSKTCPKNCLNSACNIECISCLGGLQCEESTKETVIIPWVVVPAFLITVLIIIIIVLLKRKKIKKSYKMKRKRNISTGSNVNLLLVANQSTTEGEYRPDCTPSPCHVPEEPWLGCVWSTGVQVENFRNYIQTMKKDLGLGNQFFDIPDGQLGPCDEGRRLENAIKNRYRNILPYDHSRVKLEYIQHIPCSDYINANYINGYGKYQAFVATQGPFSDVMWDFWRMVWELDTGKIVMLTNFVESRKHKCEQYWPDVGQRGINYGNIVVQCVSEKPTEEYTIRTFAIQKEGQRARTIKQYHFTAWPDHGVPCDVTSLVEFHQFVKQSPATGSGPIIVHCSAGVGRTGTFLALDYLIAQARAEGVVDVYECVTRLRHQRMNAIQTEEQYIFLHDALVEALPSAERPSGEGAGNPVPFNIRQRESETVGNPFVGQSQAAEDKRYQEQCLQAISLDTFTIQWSTIRTGETD